MKWPNDLIWQGENAAGNFLESSTYDGTIRKRCWIKQEWWRNRRFFLFWMDGKILGRLTLTRCSKLLMPGIGSILDSTPPIDSIENTIWQQKSWAKLSQFYPQVW
ncbi:MAG: hypothetical protein Ct9H90mP14_2640 [Methanobacteriota archaeon]|nr:MAG: hypothetical protein Ct9H90mP14_2640 [Euryarchaeota archaeon]